MISKEVILKEIQERARKNGGRPLSAKRFEEETGIKSYYWQKYWARFGDAQSAAGYTPNTFLKTPYKHDDLCEKFISLIRELKKWPTKGEIEVKHNVTKFPGSGIFYRNLGQGKKQNLVNKILEYASRKNYQDIIKVCDVLLLEFEEQNKSTAEEINDKKHGWVYLGKSGVDYKIGFTRDIIRRYNEITIQLPNGLTHIHDIETDDPSGIEAYWHERFKSKRKNGEWFRLNASDVKAFRRWKRIV